MRYFVEISRQGDGYSALAHQGNLGFGRSTLASGLGSATTLAISGRSYTLQQISTALSEYRLRELGAIYDERGQIEIGQHLYRQIFGEVRPDSFRQQSGDSVDLRIITDDEHIMALPWGLLAHQGLFLAATGWSITMARSVTVPDVTITDRPRVLIVAPEPAGLKTRAADHLEKLEYRLALSDHRLTSEQNLRHVTTWDACCSMLKSFQPDILYYYGHGVGDQGRARLIFADQNGRKVEKPITDLAQLLRELPTPPRLVYLNCCGGDAGGFLGAGRQIGQVVPAVIANRTVAHTDAAQVQALAILQSILVDGRPPHVALSEINGRLTELGMSFSDARWLTPVLYSNYRTWTAPAAQRADDAIRDPHWHLKLDRVGQFGTVAFQTRQMLRERHPRSLAYVWYGKAGQGIDMFHKRLGVELRADLASHAQLLEVRPEWPMQLDNPGRSFSDMMTEAFEVQDLKAISSSIREQTHASASRIAVIYVRHQPVRLKSVLNPSTLKAYLQWWDGTFAPLLNNHQHVLLTISFEVDNPASFRDILLNRVGLYEIEFNHTIFRLLDEMERLALKDLFDFLQIHNIRLPRSHKDRILQEILEKTGGHYEQTISELRRLVERALDAASTHDQPAHSEADIFDY
jgi:hypothetical protein